MGGTDRCVYAKNVVPWEAQTGMFRLRMLRHGRHKLVCLCHECSVMGGTDRCVYTNNVVVPWEAQTGMFTLRM